MKRNVQRQHSLYGQKMRYVTLRSCITWWLMTCYYGNSRPITGPFLLTRAEEATHTDRTGELSKSAGEIVKGNCDILSCGHKMCKGIRHSNTETTVFLVLFYSVRNYLQHSDSCTKMAIKFWMGSLLERHVTKSSRKTERYIRMAMRKLGCAVDTVHRNASE
jgi:hypothetical protein